MGPDEEWDIYMIYRYFKVNNDFSCNFTDLGSFSIVPQKWFQGLEHFVCALYSSKSDTGDVNEIFSFQRKVK